MPSHPTASLGIDIGGSGIKGAPVDLEVGALVEENVGRAITGLMENNPTLLAEALRVEKEIDRKEVRNEEECLKIIALYQPVANDLRYLIVILKVNHELERIGDLAKAVAKAAPNIRPEAVEPYLDDLRQLAEYSRRQVVKSLDALVRGDEQGARDNWLFGDEEVDRQTAALSSRLEKDIVAHTDRAPSLFALLNAAKNLERLADHAANISKDVIYMIDGEIARHRGKELRARGRASTGGE